MVQYTGKQKNDMEPIPRSRLRQQKEAKTTISPREDSKKTTKTEENAHANITYGNRRTGHSSNKEGGRIRK